MLGSEFWPSTLAARRSQLRLQFHLHLDLARQVITKIIRAREALRGCVPTADHQPQAKRHYETLAH